MNIDTDVIGLSKGGEVRAMVTLGRGMGKDGHGATLTIKVHPAVEEYMRELGAGETVEVGTQGRHWSPVLKEVPFLAYELNHPIEGVKTPSGLSVGLDRLGSPLTERMDRGEFVNLSFLRLVGASEGVGVGFKIKGVYSDASLKKMRDQISESLRQFYLSYIRPINLAIVMSTQDR